MLGGPGVEKSRLTKFISQATTKKPNSLKMPGEAGLEKSSSTKCFRRRLA